MPNGQCNQKDPAPIRRGVEGYGGRKPGTLGDRAAADITVRAAYDRKMSQESRWGFIHRFLSTNPMASRKKAPLNAEPFRLQGKSPAVFDLSPRA